MSYLRQLIHETLIQVSGCMWPQIIIRIFVFEIKLNEVWNNRIAMYIDSNDREGRRSASVQVQILASEGQAAG